MSQSDVVKRIQEICKEFDARVDQVGLAIARLELAKALAEAEAAQHSMHPTALLARVTGWLSRLTALFHWRDG